MTTKYLSKDKVLFIIGKHIMKKVEKRCICEDKQCAKCLLINCQDDDCKTHPKEFKERFKENYKNRKK